MKKKWFGSNSFSRFPFSVRGRGFPAGSGKTFSFVMWRYARYFVFSPANRCDQSHHCLFIFRGSSNKNVVFIITRSKQRRNHRFNSQPISLDPKVTMIQLLVFSSYDNDSYSLKISNMICRPFYSKSYFHCRNRLIISFLFLSIWTKKVSVITNIDYKLDSLSSEPTDNFTFNWDSYNLSNCRFLILA